MPDPGGADDRSPRLRAELGIFGAMMMGLGSIVGTGIFVSIGIAAGVAGPGVVPAIAVAALVAVCNGLSSAQLAANHPVSGGTYEYGYRYAAPWVGFLAGWMFLWAKTASAATAALGFSGYLLTALGAEGRQWLVPVAVGIVALLTLLVWGGIRRSNHANILIVALTLLALACFVLFGVRAAWSLASENLVPFFSTPDASRSAPGAFLEACALMFVAFTGYGRIATLGEEVHEPRRTIPRAIWLTLIVAAALYMLVALVAVGTVGAPALAAMTQGQAAPLEQVAARFETAWVARVVAIGAITAMAGVLLNLILGLSRVLLAMGRRGDMPRAVARLDATEATPMVAVPVMGLAIAALVLPGSVRSAWSFSAFTVLVYYAITNWCALRLPAGERFYPRWVAAAGLTACLSLAFFVEMQIWIFGLGLVAAGLAWHALARRIRTASAPL